MKSLKFPAVAAILLGCAQPLFAQSQVPSVKGVSVNGYTLVWSDEFDGATLDPVKWNYRTDSKHWSTQKPENVTISNGILHLAVKKEEAGKMHYTGAGIISKQPFKYGLYEARFKVPPGAGWHSSFWMMFYNGKGGTSPAAACQELDVIENDSIHKQSYGVNVHKWKGEHVAFGGKSVKTPDLSADFHVYGCEFTPQTVKYFFDGALVQTVDVATPRKKDGKPFAFEHGDQHIWLTTIASKLGNTTAVDDTSLPASADYDYVRFFVKK